MEYSTIEKIMNPFIWIRGSKALLWGLAGLLVSSFISWLSGYHYYGLLHFGTASNSATWCYVVEHLIVWLVPSCIFYIGGLFFSESHIRPIDVLGTVLFAQLPLLGMNLIDLLTPTKLLTQYNPNDSLSSLISQPGYLLAMLLSVLQLPFLVLMLIWLIKALKVSCNLKGLYVWLIGLIGIVGGDLLCSYIIRYLY